jgi:hypothetical protein
MDAKKRCARRGRRRFRYRDRDRGGARAVPKHKFRATLVYAVLLGRGARPLRRQNCWPSSRADQHCPVEAALNKRHIVGNTVGTKRSQGRHARARPFPKARARSKRLSRRRAGATTVEKSDSSVAQSRALRPASRRYVPCEFQRGMVYRTDRYKKPRTATRCPMLRGGFFPPFRFHRGDRRNYTREHERRGEPKTACATADVLRTPVRFQTYLAQVARLNAGHHGRAGHGAGAIRPRSK